MSFRKIQNSTTVYVSSKVSCSFSNTFRTLIAILFLSTAFHATSIAQVRTITFDEAIRIALDRNIDLQRATNALETQGTFVTQTRGAFFPNLFINVNPSQRYGLQFDQTAGQLVQETTTAMNASVGAQVNLFNGFGDLASYRQAQADFEATSHQLQRTRQTVIFNVISRYLELVQNREMIGIMEENLESQRGQLARIEEFTRVGARPISELYQMQANVASAELDLLNAERAYQLSATQLIQILELDPFGEYAFEAPTADEVTLEHRQYDLGQLLRTAFEARPDIRAQRLTIEAGEEGIRAARSNVWPTVSLSTSYGSNYSSRIPRNFEQQLLEDNRGGGVNFSISIPLFNRFQTRSQIDRSRIAAQNARLELQNVQQNVALEVRQAYLDYETAAKRVQVTEVQLRAADMALQAEQERYNVGASTLVELNQIRAQYVQAASNRAQAVFSYLVQQKVIEYYLGQITGAGTLFN